MTLYCYTPGKDKSVTCPGGWPLYGFAGDTAPSQTNGQGVRDVWFVATPSLPPKQTGTGL